MVEPPGRHVRGGDVAEDDLCDRTSVIIMACYYTRRSYVSVHGWCLGLLRHRSCIVVVLGLDQDTLTRKERIPKFLEPDGAYFRV